MIKVIFEDKIVPKWIRRYIIVHIAREIGKLWLSYFDLAHLKFCRSILHRGPVYFSHRILGLIIDLIFLRSLFLVDEVLELYTTARIDLEQLL